MLGDRDDEWKQETDKQVEGKSQEESLSHRGGGWINFMMNQTFLEIFQAKLSQFKLSFDRTATYVFPLMFIAFNMFYWTVYLFIMPMFIVERK